MISMNRRFVIQLHSTDEGSHYDFMVDIGQALATWRLDRLPLSLGPDDNLPAERLPDHRRDYLSYQGPIGGGRGTVRIIDAGRCRILVRSRDTWRIQLAGRQAQGVFTVRRLERGKWQFSRTTQRARCAE